MYQKVQLSGSLNGALHGPPLRFKTYLQPTSYHRMVADWAPVAVLRTRVVDQAVQTPATGYSRMSLGALNGVLHAAPGRLRGQWYVVGYVGLVGEARWRSTAEIGSLGIIQATCRADGVASAWAVGTIQPENVLGECRADGVGNAYVDLEPLPGECRADGGARAWCVGYARSFAQADGQATAAVARIIQRIKGLRVDGQATAICDSTQVRQATARADGHATATVLASLGLPLTCIVDDGALPGPSPASPRNYAR